MDEKKRAELKEKTIEEAADLLEDMTHIRVVLGETEPNRAEIRNISIILRRLLSQSERLRWIANPRIGNLQIPIPDNSPFYRESRNRKCSFFLSGGATIFGTGFGGVLSGTGGRMSEASRNYKPDVLTHQPLLTFVRQRVICFNDHWITRKQVIDYVANVMNVAHADNPAKKSYDDYLIDRVRQAAAIKRGSGLYINTGATKPVTIPFKYDPDGIDVVLFELFSTAHFLVTAPDVQRLEHAIREELALM